MKAVDALLKPEQRVEAPDGRAAALVWTAHPGAEVTVGSLRRGHPGLAVTVAPHPLSVAGIDDHISDGDLASVMRAMTMAHPGRHVLVVLEPVVVPLGFLDRALEALDADLRLASISFLSNDAGYLSFPYRNQPTIHQVDDLDERSVTQRLRELGPPGSIASIPVPAGSAVVLSRWALSACADFRSAPLPAAEGRALTLAAWGLEAQRRGFVSGVDTSTYISRAYDLAPPFGDPLADGAGRQWLFESHPWFPAMHDDQRFDDESPLGIWHRVARVKVQGLRVGVDATCLGPKEMGTQVQTLSLIGALCDRTDVSRVAIALPGPVPAYARDTLADPKVDVVIDPLAELATVGDLDVMHRPFQPDGSLPFDRWRERAARTILTLQDLIAYQVGSYHHSVDDWLVYRKWLRDAAARADAVVVISEDIRRQLNFEGLPADPDRVHVVPNGTDHLRGDEDVAAPLAMVRAGFVAGAFVLVLGANYSHKNRDLAIRAWQHLRATTHPELALVLVGAYVPFGSSRFNESRTGVDDDADVFVLADVTSPERNWLLRHASAVLYPTSAEGFGLVPFEAARFGTPTVEVSFGPLAEVTPDLPVVAADWSPEALAAATKELIEDPALARASIDATLRAGAGLSWERSAAGLVDVYRDVLARPRRAAS